MFEDENRKGTFVREHAYEPSNGGRGRIHLAAQFLAAAYPFQGERGAGQTNPVVTTCGERQVIKHGLDAWIPNANQG